MKTMLIDGASGYIASRFIQHLEQTNEFRLISCSDGIVSLNERQYDINNLRTEAGIEKIDVVVPFGSNTSLYGANESPLKAINSNLKMIESLSIFQEIEIARVVFPSSVTVYGVSPQCPVLESSAPDPVNFYDLQKSVAEQFLRLLSQRNGMSVCLMRLANVYGFGASMESSGDRGVLNKVVRNIAEGKTIKILGVGNCQRDYIHLDDVCSAFMSACLSDRSGCNVYNVCSGRSISVKGAFSLAIEKGGDFGFDSSLVEIDAPQNFDRSEFRNFVGCPDALRSDFNWEPRISLNKGLENMFENFADRISGSN